MFCRCRISHEENLLVNVPRLLRLYPFDDDTLSNGLSKQHVVFRWKANGKRRIPPSNSADESDTRCTQRETAQLLCAFSNRRWQPIRVSTQHINSWRWNSPPLLVLTKDIPHVRIPPSLLPPPTPTPHECNSNESYKNMHLDMQRAYTPNKHIPAKQRLS